MHKLIRIFALISLLSMAMLANECDDLFKKYGTGKTNREVFVIVDKSTPFPNDIKKNALISILSLVEPETAVAVFSFSEYTKGKYLNFVDRYYFDSVLSESVENDMPASKINVYKQCLSAYDDGLRRKLAEDIYKEFRVEGSKDSSKRSEILYSLKEIANNAVSVSPAKEKIVFILSDMLENSSYLSLYKVKKLADLNIEKTLETVKKNKLLTDFHNASIYVVGVGLLEKEGSYLDGRDKDSLKAFWSDYFKDSNANLKFFQTELTYPIVGR